MNVSRTPPVHRNSTCVGNSGQVCEADTGWASPERKNVIAPETAQSRTSFAPASKYSIIFYLPFSSFAFTAFTFGPQVNQAQTTRSARLKRPIVFSTVTRPS